jgi:serine protease
MITMIMTITFTALKAALRLTCTLACVLACALAAQQQLHAQTPAAPPTEIVIKFKSGCEPLQHWLAAKRTGTIPALAAVLPNHSSTPFVDDRLLRCTEKFFADRSESVINTGLQGSNSTFDSDEQNAVSKTLHSLERICVIGLPEPSATSATRTTRTTSTTSTPQHKILRQLAHLPFLEYAELHTHGRTADTMPATPADPPNDPSATLQTHLPQIRAFDAWREAQRVLAARGRPVAPPTSPAPVVIAIVDTGVQLNHEDLRTVIATNSGEAGTDAQGRDKRSNGVDDDSNGYVDDWRGWDFVSTSNTGGTTGAARTGQDNDPSPGSSHGTHVAGLAAAAVNNALGVAGATPFARILPVKVASDNGIDGFVQRGYQGVLYAAAMGASVINCSWTYDRASAADAEIVRLALSMGAVITAAAGNQFTFLDRYPAAFAGVLSVASVTADDIKAGSSNYHTSVGIATPGAFLFSTILNNSYGYLSGTSMASPVTAAVAALVRLCVPELSPEQVVARLRATTDDISATNRSFDGFMGAGRLNALAAVRQLELAPISTSSSVPLATPPSTTKPSGAFVRWINLNGYALTDENSDGAISPRERFSIRLQLKNMLAPALAGTQVRLSVVGVNSNGDINYSPQDAPQLASEAITLPAFATLQERTLSGSAEEIVLTAAATSVSARAGDVYANTYWLRLRIVDPSGALIGQDYIRLEMNPAFRTIALNNTALTLNPAGALGFDDYPTNVQGSGLALLPSAVSNDAASGALNFLTNPFASSFTTKRLEGAYNLLYEGGLMIATSASNISDAVRIVFGAQRKVFKPLPQAVSGGLPSQIFRTTFTNASAGGGASVGANASVSAVFSDDATAAERVGVRVEQTASQSLGRGLDNVTLLSYTITNAAQRDFTSLHVGLFMDWDIGLTVADNEIYWDNTNSVMIGQSTERLSRQDAQPPVVGMLLSSALPAGAQTNVYVMDASDTSTAGGRQGIVVDTEFTNAAKWQALSSGLARTRSARSDASCVLAAGPIALKRGESTTVSFALIVAPTLDSLQTSVRAVRNRSVGTMFAYPTPSTGTLVVEFDLSNDDLQAASNGRFELVNTLGQVAATFALNSVLAGGVSGGTLSAGRKQITLNTIGLAPGAYLLRLRAGANMSLQTARVLVAR